MHRKILGLAALLGLLVGPAAPLGGCGGEDKAMSREAGGATKKGGAAARPEEQVTIKASTPEWEIIRPYFKKYLDQKHTSPKNIFTPQAYTFIPRPALPEEEDAPVTEEVEEVQDEERGPLQQYPLKDYRLLMIMSGTAIPKAVVLDSKGNAFVVQVDTRIGNKGGIVKAITQYAVMVHEPDADKPEKLNIKPPFLDLVSQARAEGDLGREDQFLPEDVLPLDARPVGGAAGVDPLAPPGSPGSR
jgi:Tfp pilus assembly protein PilP